VKPEHAAGGADRDRLRFTGALLLQFLISTDKPFSIWSPQNTPNDGT
jgi:hypothetical protein